MIFLDYETRSDRNIGAEGAGRYVRDPSTQPLLLSYRIQHGTNRSETKVWDCRDPMPKDLVKELYTSDELIFAFNASFDRGIMQQCHGIPVSFNRWYCVMTMAYALGFTGGLARVGQQIGIAKKDSKLDSGDDLIRLFSIPPYGSPEEHPEEWERFKEYAQRDVDTMVRIYDFCYPYLRDRLPGLIQEYQEAQRVNDNGLPLDTGLIESAVVKREQRKKALEDEIHALLGEPPGRNNMLQELNLPNLRKETKAAALQSEPFGTYRHRLLLMETERSKTSAVKWDAFERMNYEGRLYGSYVHRGASRTGRETSRGVQVHNLKRTPKAWEKLLRQIRSQDEMSIDSLASGIRMAIGYETDIGDRLVISDINSVESVLGAVITQSESMLQLFRDGRDPYRVFASRALNCPEESIDSNTRNRYKPASLGCQYMLGGKGLRAYAEGFGVRLVEEEAQRQVNDWRQLYPEFRAWWTLAENALFHCVTTGESQTIGPEINCRMHGEFLQILAGRFDLVLHYHKPELHDCLMPWTDQEGAPVYRKGLTFMGRDPVTTQWTRIQCHMGHILENICQGSGAAILRAWISESLQKGFRIVGSTHDEIIGEDFVDNAENTLDSFNHIISKTLADRYGIPLRAEGFISTHYRKG